MPEQPPGAYVRLVGEHAEPPACLGRTSRNTGLARGTEQYRVPERGAQRRRYARHVADRPARLERPPNPILHTRLEVVPLEQQCVRRPPPTDQRREQRWFVGRP